MPGLTRGVAAMPDAFPDCARIIARRPDRRQTKSLISSRVKILKEGEGLGREMGSDERGVRSEESEARSQKPEARSKKREARSQKRIGRDFPARRCVGAGAALQRRADAPTAIDAFPKANGLPSVGPRISVPNDTLLLRFPTCAASPATGSASSPREVELWHRSFHELIEHRHSKRHVTKRRAIDHPLCDQRCPRWTH